LGVLTNVPPSCKNIGCKWVFRKKLRMDGYIEKFKATLVVIGYKQIEGANFFFYILSCF